MTLRAAAEQALKPCPFCGSEPYSCRHLSYSNWGVTCECGAIGPTKNAGYRPLREAEIRAHNEAVAAWNERAALAAEQPQPEAQPVAWSVVFNGWVDADYTYSDRSAAESAASYLCKHKAELGPFRVVPLFAAPPPSAPEPSRTLTQDERDVFDAAERRSTKVVVPEPSEAQVEAAWRAIPASHEDSRVSVITKGDVWVMLRAAAAARNNNPA